MADSIRVAQPIRLQHLNLYIYTCINTLICQLLTSKEETFQRGNLESSNLCVRLTFSCTVVYRSFQPKKILLLLSPN